jgi:hypothetical protein
MLFWWNPMGGINYQLECWDSEGEEDKKVPAVEAALVVKAEGRQRWWPLLATYINSICAGSPVLSSALWIPRTSNSCTIKIYSYLVCAHRKPASHSTARWTLLDHHIVSRPIGSHVIQSISTRIMSHWWHLPNPQNIVHIPTHREFNPSSIALEGDHH